MQPHYQQDYQLRDMDYQHRDVDYQRGPPGGENHRTMEVTEDERPEFREGTTDRDKRMNRQIM